MRSLCPFSVLLALIGCGDPAPDEPPGDVSPTPIPFSYPLDDLLRVNDVQVKGTHNSYHLDPGAGHESWRYSHAPLAVQLAEQGVRQFELDLYRFDEDFEVLHIPVLDEQTTCPLLVDCLDEMKRWSDLNPAHLPILVLLEPKDSYSAGRAAAYFTRLEEEILSVWPRQRILTPDDVRGDDPDLLTAQLERGWPTLGESRGKIVFTLLDGGEHRDFYRDGGQLEGKLLFVNADPTERFAGFVLMDDAISDFAAIQAGAAAGLLIRTRATDEASAEAGLASGAHALSTDNPVPAEPGEFWLDVPGGAPARCNPVSAPPECTALALEDPAFIQGLAE